MLFHDKRYKIQSLFGGGNRKDSLGGYERLLESHENGSDCHLILSSKPAPASEHDSTSPSASELESASASGESASIAPRPSPIRAYAKNGFCCSLDLESLPRDQNTLPLIQFVVDRMKTRAFQPDADTIKLRSLSVASCTLRADTDNGAKVLVALNVSSKCSPEAPRSGTSTRLKLWSRNRGKEADFVPPKFSTFFRELPPIGVSGFDAQRLVIQIDAIFDPENPVKDNAPSLDSARPAPANSAPSSDLGREADLDLFAMSKIVEHMNTRCVEYLETIAPITDGRGIPNDMNKDLASAVTACFDESLHAIVSQNFLFKAASNSNVAHRFKPFGEQRGFSANEKKSKKKTKGRKKEKKGTTGGGVLASLKDMSKFVSTGNQSKHVGPVVPAKLKKKKPEEEEESRPPWFFTLARNRWPPELKMPKKKTKSRKRKTKSG